MERNLKRNSLAAEFGKTNDGYDLDDLLHPLQAFEHPSNVVTDSDLTLNEKRAILASWASDACAIEAMPALRQAPGGRKVVRFDDVMEALRTLDKHAQQTQNAARYRRMLRGKRFGKRSDSDDGNHGQENALN
jgi:hypothetical protein